MPPKMKFADGEKVLCFHGPLLYEAKCVKFEVKDKINRYFIHYNGWNKNWDEWVPESRVLKCNEAGFQKQRELLKAHIGAKKAKAAAKKLERERERERSSTPTSDKPKNSASEKQKPSERGKEKSSSDRSKKGAENEKQKGSQSERGKAGSGSEKQKTSAQNEKQKGSAAEKRSSAAEKHKASEKQKPTLSTERQKAVSEKQKERAAAAAAEKSKTGAAPDKKQKDKTGGDKSGGDKTATEKPAEKMSTTPILLSSQDSLASSQSSGSSADQMKRKRKADSTVEAEDSYLGKIEVKIKIPDELKPWLVDDWDLITRQKQLVSLPCRISVNQLLDDYFKFKTVKGTNVNKDAILEVCNGIKEYFNVMLGTQLLYKFERPQYSDILTEQTEKPLMCNIYGPVHLLRLFVKLGSMLAFTTLDDKSIQLLQTHINDLLKYMQKNLSSLFSLHDYIVASPEYHRKAI